MSNLMSDGGSSGTIRISASIQDYAEKFAPLVQQMKEYALEQQNLYDDFKYYYSGRASEEVEEYADKHMKQIVTLIEGYAGLSAMINEIVLNFLMIDEECGEELLSFLKIVYPEVVQELEAEAAAGVII